jgi:hypothetical protein
MSVELEPIANEQQLNYRSLERRSSSSSSSSCSGNSTFLDQFVPVGCSC